MSQLGFGSGGDKLEQRLGEIFAAVCENYLAREEETTAGLLARHT